MMSPVESYRIIAFLKLEEFYLSKPLTLHVNICVDFFMSQIYVNFNDQRRFQLGSNWDDPGVCQRSNLRVENRVRGVSLLQALSFKHRGKPCGV